ncbi:MAG: WYL domain-containing protein [Prevotella sp.]|nr:WYL domain-containing protein [Prevotella sp.]
MESSSVRFQKWFDLILAMVDGRQHKVRELASVLGTSVRNFYYVVQVLERIGFRVIHEGHGYYIDPKSPFLKRISQTISMSDDEANYLYGLLSTETEDLMMAGILKRKLSRFYALPRLDDTQMQLQQYANLKEIEYAINHKKVAILHEYSSPHSHTVTDRLVEPFDILGNKADVRAYELKSGQNKTFKMSRVGRVEVVDTPWFNEARHRRVFTDMFMFSGEKYYHVKLRFSLLAHHLMLEEYPHSIGFMRNEDDSHWIFETDVVSYVGLSRFILGLYEDVEILEDDGLRAFVKEKISRMTAVDSDNE